MIDASVWTVLVLRIYNSLSSLYVYIPFPSSQNPIHWFAFLHIRHHVLSPTRFSSVLPSKDRLQYTQTADVNGELTDCEVFGGLCTLLCRHGSSIWEMACSENALLCITICRVVGIQSTLVLGTAGVDITDCVSSLLEIIDCASSAMWSDWRLAVMLLCEFLAVKAVVNACLDIGKPWPMMSNLAQRHR